MYLFWSLEKSYNLLKLPWCLLSSEPHTEWQEFYPSIASFRWPLKENGRIQMKNIIAMNNVLVRYFTVPYSIYSSVAYRMYYATLIHAFSLKQGKFSDQ